MSFTLPETGYVFWPVGTGDSTTIVIDEDTVVQVDLHHQAQAEDDEAPQFPIIDELERLLPKRDGRPYLAVFVLTHPDRDHILGFEELLERIDIGEIWHTPTIFREFEKDLCDDACAFKEEVERRRDKTIRNDGEVESGDRIVVIGYDELFGEEEYEDFPTKWRRHPASVISEVDGCDCADVFEAFVHAPFKDDAGSDERNETSLALHITLRASTEGKALFLGDLSYPAVKRIFDKTKEKERSERLEWHILLAPHHCSKSVMYWKGEDDEEVQLKQDIMQEFEDAALENGRVISSSECAFTDTEGSNPPHKKARARYEEIVESGHFLCTHEYPNTQDPEPIKFELNGSFDLVSSASDSKSKSSNVAEAVKAARGSDAPPQKSVGFGQNV